MTLFQQQTTENLFEITNLSEISFDFKLIPIGITHVTSQDQLYFRELNKAVKAVASKIGGPATLFWKNEKQYIAIPATSNFASFILNSKPTKQKLEAQDEIHRINFSDCSDQEYQVISNFLEFSIRQQIKKSSRIIEEGTGRFIYKRSLGGFENNSVDLLHGFTFRLMPEGREKLFVSLDITYRYIDKNYLNDHITKKSKGWVEQVVLNSRANKSNGIRFLYEMGDWWFPIEVFCISENSAKDEIVLDKESNTHISLEEYVLRRTEGHRNSVKSRLKPDDSVVYFKYPGKEMDYLSAPASLIRQLYKPDDKKIGKLHTATIKEVDERFKFAKSRIYTEFQNIKVNGCSIKISDQLLDSNLPAFPLKDLKFKGGQIIKGTIKKDGLEITNNNYARMRKSMLNSVGVLKAGSFDDTQYLIVPDTTNFPGWLRSHFQKLFESRTNQLCPDFTGFKKIITYDANKHSVTDLVAEVAKSLELENITAGYALVILPYWGEDDKSIGLFHDFLKYQFKDSISFQCASAEKIRGFFQHQKGADPIFIDEDKAKKFSPYIFNLVLEYLKLNERYPYALEKEPNYDIYVGIDVHQQFVGFCFFYRNGETIKIQRLEIPRPPSKTRYEKLQAEQVYKILYPTLKRHIPRYCPNPNSVIIIRDGSSHSGEQLALSKTLQNLAKDGLIEQSRVSWAIVDLHKKSQLPFRVGSRDDVRKQYDRPLAGTVRVAGRNREQAFLFPTGFPFLTRGSARPLHFTMVKNSPGVSFGKILEDLFGQCLLAFSAPDRPNGLPIVIKLLDDYLEPFSLSKQRLDALTRTDAQDLLPDDEDSFDEDNFENWDESKFTLIDKQS